MIKILKSNGCRTDCADFYRLCDIGVYDTNKGKLPGKSVDVDIGLPGLKGDVNITADELYKNLIKRMEKGMLFMKFQAEVILQQQHQDYG